MLREKVKSGFLWGTGLNVFRDVLQFGMMLVLVRILAPAAYGQFGFVTTLVGLFTVLSFRGFIEHTLQLRPQEEVDYQNYFTIGAIIQLVVFVAINGVALGLRYFPEYAATAPLVHVMSVLFLLDLLHEFRVKMLERALNWKHLRIVQAVGTLLSAIAAVVLALSGAGVYALLVPGILVTLPAAFDLLVVGRWRPTWKIDFAAFRPAWRYGWTRIGSGAMVTGRQLIESSALVHVMGFTAFGLYGRAVGFAAIACLKLPSLLSLMLYPILTKIQPRTEAYARASGLVLQSVAWVAIPGAALFSVIAEPTIRVLYGNKWLAAVPLVPWALVAAVAMGLAQTASILLLASCEQKKCLIADGVTLVGTVASLWLLAPRGLASYLAGVAATQFISLALMLYWLYERGAVTRRALWNALVLPVAAVACVAIGGQWIVRTWSGTVPGGIFAAAYATVFTLAYVAILRLTSARPLGELVSYCPGADHLRRLLVLEA